MICNTIPPEIVLKIVSYLHTPVTFRHYERISFMSLDFLNFNVVQRAVLYDEDEEIWARILDREQVILNVNKYDPTTFNVTAAKNLRLVSSSFANTFGPLYIYHNIGGSFMVKVLSNTAILNSRLAREYLKPIAGMVVIDNLKSELCYHCDLCISRIKFIREDVIELLKQYPPQNIFNNSLCSSIITPYIETKEKQLIYYCEKNKQFFNNLMSYNEELFGRATRKQSHDEYFSVLSQIYNLDEPFTINVIRNTTLTNKVKLINRTLIDEKYVANNSAAAKDPTLAKKVKSIKLKTLRRITNLKKKTTKKTYKKQRHTYNYKHARKYNNFKQKCR